MVLQNICIAHIPLNTPYMDNPRSMMTAVLTGRPRLIHRLGLKVKATSIYEEHVLLEGQGWSPDPPCLCAPILHSDLKIC